MTWNRLFSAITVFIYLRNIEMSLGGGWERDVSIGISPSAYTHENVRNEFCDLPKCRSIEAALVSIYRGVTTSIVDALFSLVVAIHHHRRRARSDQRFYPRPSINFHSYWPTNRWTCLQRSVIAWSCAGRAARLSAQIWESTFIYERTHPIYLLLLCYYSRQNCAALIVIY